MSGRNSCVFAVCHNYLKCFLSSYYAWRLNIYVVFCAGSRKEKSTCLSTTVSTVLCFEHIFSEAYLFINVQETLWLIAHVSACASWVLI